MFIKRAKSRPSLRAKEIDEESPSASSSTPLSKGALNLTEGDDGSDQPLEEGGSVMERKKAKGKEKKGPSKSSRLSFGGDTEPGAEGTPFKPRKSLLSQTFKLSTPQSAPTASSSRPSHSYSSEYLSELKASTPSRAPKAAVEDEEDIDEEDGTGLSRAARNKYASNFVEDTTAGIPDAAAIASAKNKRQAAVESKKHGLGDDYISLGNGQISVYDGEKGPHPESRLMREEDEGEEGDEELADYTEVNERVHLGKGANRAAARRLKGEIGELIADREAEDEDDEETREWEEAQVRRAGNMEVERAPVAHKPSYTPANIPAVRQIPTIASAQARLAKGIAGLKLTEKESEHNLEVTRRELVTLEQQERDLRVEVERVEGKREWVEEFRGWIETLGSFLEEKVPKLDDVEADGIHHYKERAEMTHKRRFADDEDDLALFLGCPAAKEEDVEVDELGRSRNTEAGPSSNIRRARRNERHNRRQRRSSRRPQKQVIDDDDGFSTDSTLAEGDAQDYATAQHNLEGRVRGLLEDVRAEDFRDPRKGLAVRFGDWRKRYEEEYINAFGGLAMVQAWEFWARGEMIGWEPLRGSAPLESFSWFTALHDYSRPKPAPNGNVNADGAGTEDDDMEMDDDEPAVGPEGDLVPEMVTKVVVPLLTKAFQAGAYDPYSTPQTRRAVDLAEVIRDLAGNDSRKYMNLLKTIFEVYHKEITRLSEQVSASSSSTSIPPPAVDPASRTSMQRFIRRRIKLLRNILLWRRENLSEVKVLLNRLIGDVIRPAVHRSWTGGGKEMAAQVFSVVGTDIRPDLAVALREGPTGFR